MKKLKKALIGVTSVCMALSMAVFTACGETHTHAYDQKVATEEYLASAATCTQKAKYYYSCSCGEKGTETFDDGELAAHTVVNGVCTVCGAVTDAALAVSSSVSEQTVAGLKVEYAIDSKYLSSYYSCDEDGDILTDETTNEEVEITYNNQQMSISGNLTFNTGDFGCDLTVNRKYSYLNDAGTAIKKDEEGNELTSDYDTKIAIRDGYLFSHDDYEVEEDEEGNKTDYWTADGSISELLEDIPSELSALISQSVLSTVASGSVKTLLTTLIGLGEAYGGVTVSDGKITLDLNEIVYNLYTDAYDFIDGMTESTTVADVIAAKPVKALIESLTYQIDVKSIYDKVMDMTSSLQEGAATAAEEGEDTQLAVWPTLLAAIPVPEEDDTVYTYLVKALESKEFAGVILQLVAPSLPASAIAPFAEFTVIDLVNTITGGTGDNALTIEGENGIKAMVKGVLDSMVDVSKDSFKFTEPANSVYSNGSIVTTISGLTATLTVNSKYEITALSFSGEIVNNSDTVGVSASLNGTPTSWSHYITTTTLSIDISADFGATAYALTDVSDNTLVYYGDYEFDDEEQYICVGYYNIYSEEGEDAGTIPVYAKVTMTDGVLSVAGDNKLYKRSYNEEGEYTYTVYTTCTVTPGEDGYYLTVTDESGAQLFGGYLYVYGGPEYGYYEVDCQYGYVHFRAKREKISSTIGDYLDEQESASSAE